MITGLKGSWAQFGLICRSHSTKELYSVADLYSTPDLYSGVDRFPLHFFLWTFLTLQSSWWVFGPCFSLGFPLYMLLSLASYWAFFLVYGFAKMGINIQPPEHMDCSCNSYANTYAVFFCGLFHNSCECFSSFLRGPVVSILTFLRQIVLFLSVNLWPF